jgi:hypothetical protein
MKFIRDIISEKRNVRPASMPLPPQTSDDDRFEAPEMAASFPQTAEAAPPAYDLPEPQAEAFVEPEAEELNLFAAEEAEGMEDRFSESELDAWVNGDVPLPEDTNPEPEAMDPALFHSEYEDEQDILDREAGAPPRSLRVEPDPVRPSLEGTLYLDAGSLRAVKQVSPFDRLKKLETQREDAITASEPPPRQPIDEARLRLAMKGGEYADTTRGAPVFPEAVSAPAPLPAEDPLPQPSLSEMPFVSARQADMPGDIAPDASVQIPPPAAGRGSNRSGRVKTRLLGFNPENLGLANPLERAESRANDPFPVAWLVVVSGPGRGASFALHDGVARVGRGEDQTVCLNFGDNSISRENHISIAYDSEQCGFFVGQSGRSNIVRLNNKPLLSTEQIRSGDQIRLGETTLRLVALCGEGFSWTRTLERA